MNAIVRSVLLLCSLALAMPAPAQSVLPFHAPPVTAGSIAVRLHPTEAVPIGSPRLVSFGLPLPRGSLSEAGLATVRVTDAGGAEIAAHVSQLTPWRHRSDATLDGTSVRIALLQFEHSPSVAYPGHDVVTVRWGGAARSLDRPLALDPRSAWHGVDGGSFVAADQVEEPDIYAVLPRDWLAQGLLKSSRSLPFDDANTELRDNPALIDAIDSWPAFQEAEHAHKNNFYTVINEDSAGLPGNVLCPYRTGSEPWLYDRAATMFLLYVRSGSFKALREAVRATEFYADRLNAQGFFTLAAGDTKYAYNESLAYLIWTTGDTSRLPQVAAVAAAQQSFNHSWTGALGFWTERHAAFKLLANVVAYEVLGDTAYRDRVDAILTALRAHQDGVGQTVQPARIDGGLYHTGNQHGESAIGWSSAMGASSWMSALLLDAAVRAYASGEDAATAGFVERLARFIASTPVNVSNPFNSPPATLPAPLYAVLETGGSASTLTNGEHEHALNAAAGIAWGVYFDQLGGGGDPALRAVVEALYGTYDDGVNFWIRPTAPPANTAYRVNPWRKWGWEHRTSDGIGFALSLQDGSRIFANGFEAP